jgi:hypothetical protein
MCFNYIVDLSNGMWYTLIPTLPFHKMSFTGHVALSLVHVGTLGIEQVKHRTLPKSVVDVCRVVYQAKCSLIKVSGL